MKIEEEMSISTAYRLGKGKARAILLKLAKPSQKATVYSHVSHLKGLKNKKDFKYQIFDDVPEELGEEQRRMWQIYATNMSLPMDSWTEMSLKKGKLIVGDAPHKKKIQEVTAKNLLKSSDQELHDLQEVSTTAVQYQSEKGSEFFAYAAKVASMEDVRKLHKHEC